MKLTRILAALVWTLAVLSFTPAQAAQVKVVVIPMSGDDLKPLKNVITVAKANGDFTDPVAAVASIPTTGANAASASNPYLVVIAPGVYTVTSTLIMKPYVDIAGSGQDVTKITGAVSTNIEDATSAIVSGANNTELSDLTLENTGNSNAIGIFVKDVNMRLRRLSVTATQSGAFNTLIYIDGSSVGMTDLSLSAVNGASSFGVEILGSSRKSIVNMTNITVTVSGGTANFAISASSSDVTLSNVDAIASGGSSSNYGIQYFGNFLRVTSSRLEGKGGTSHGGLFLAGSANISNTIISGGVANDPVGTQCHNTFDEFFVGVTC